MMNVSLLAMSSVGHQWHESPVDTQLPVLEFSLSQIAPSTVHSLRHHQSHPRQTINILHIFLRNVNDNFINFDLCWQDTSKKWIYWEKLKIFFPSKNCIFPCLLVYVVCTVLHYTCVTAQLYSTVYLAWSWFLPLLPLVERRDSQKTPVLYAMVLWHVLVLLVISY